MGDRPLAQLSTATLLKRVIGAKLKEFFYPQFLGSMGSFFLGPQRTAYNYAAEVGQYAGLVSSVVMPVVQFLMRSFPEAPVIIEKHVGDEYETVHEHPLPSLIAQPNGFYSGSQLWMATVLDWALWGESYWRILPARGGRPAELWWLPPWSIQPQWPADGSVFISHYVCSPEGESQINLPIEEVVHFRHGLDPYNLRHGLPPLRGVFQDIWVDQESSHFVAAMLRNMGVPGLIISPKGAESTLSPDEVTRVQAYIQSRFSGDNRGRPMALGAPTDVQKLSMAPSDLALTDVRNTAEERVCASLGIPAAVVGYGTGLDTTKVGATMTEMRRLAWQNGIIPIQRIMAAELNRTLLPWYETDSDQFRVNWDYHEVEALQESENDKAARMVQLVAGTILKRSEARELLGYESDKTDEVYHLSNNVTEIQDGEPLREPEPVVMPAPVNGNGAQNGNGNGAANGNGRAVVQQRAAALKQGTLEELIMAQISRRAGRMDSPPRALLRLAAKLWRAEQKLLPGFQAKLEAVLKRYGEYVATAAREVIPTKQPNLDDLIQTAIIHERVPLVAVRFELREVYEALYDAMAAMTIELMQEAMDLPLTDTPAIQARLRLVAGERVRLLNLETEARNNIAELLEQARTESWSEDVLADALRIKVPSGRWTTPDIRANIMARTESRFAGNLASSAYAQQHGLGKVLILDARLGPTDEICEARNGFVVSPAEGQMMAGTEHPHGTLTILPIPNQAESSVTSQ